MFTPESRKPNRRYGLQEIILRQIFRTQSNTDYELLKDKIQAAFPEDHEMGDRIARARHEEKRERDILEQIVETFMERLAEGLLNGQNPDFLVEELEEYLEGIDEGLEEARSHTLLALIELILESRFGDEGLKLFEEIQEIEELDLLEAIYDKVDSIETLEALRRIYK